MCEKRTRKQWRRQERYLERCRKRQQNGDSKGGISKIIVMFLLFAVAIFGMYIYFGSYEKITEVVGSTEVKPPVKPIKDVKKEVKIKTKKTKLLLAKHTIYNQNSGADRNWNMKIAAQIINGSNGKGYLLKSGEKFSWLEVVGDTTSEKGFKEAPVIYGRQVTLGLGGGVCQVSSAINSAVMAAGIDTYCQKHSLPSSYIHEERGDKEATVSFDSGIDFSFENTLDDPIKIRVIEKDGDVTVKVYCIKYQKN